MECFGLTWYLSFNEHSILIDDNVEGEVAVTAEIEMGLKHLIKEEHCCGYR